MIVGMDFGTTNSGIAVFDGNDLNVLPLDPDSPNPRVLRTALYITNNQNVIIGQEAVKRYFVHNLNRPVKMERVWIGEIEVITDEMYYVQDAFAWTDVLSPGRLFLSIKSSLREIEYAGTIIGPFHYSLENLVATYLFSAKLRAERLLGRNISAVTMGRPVRFAFEPEADNVAQSRLLDAAFRAGFETVYFQKEPIAAAYAYAREKGKKENVLVFDFGGGTLDITIMRVNEPGGHRVLATGGIPVAGDVFDQKLIRSKLPQHFGEGSKYGPPHKRMTIPHWIYDSFSSWQTILDLQTPENKSMLQDMAVTAERKADIEALLSLVSSNYGIQMFETIEGTKRQLSERIGAMIKLNGPDFRVHQLVTRTEFEAIIHNEIKAIDAHIDQTLADSGLKADQIDAIIRTGGSSQIPVFIKMLSQKFGAEKVLSIDAFSSVTGGLGIVAHEIEEGHSTLEAHTESSWALARAATEARKPKEDSVAKELGQVQVRGVNLDVVKRRLQAASSNESDEEQEQRDGLMIVTAEHELKTFMLPRQMLQGDQPIPLPDIVGELDRPVQTAITVDLDENLLLVTTHYRFLSVTARQLLELENVDLTLDDLHPLASEEKVCAIGRWDQIRDRGRLVMVTMRAFARKYMTPTLRNRIEGPVPFRFDKPLLGWPFMFIGGDSGSELTFVTADSRSVRIPMKALPTRGAQAFNKDRDDLLIAAMTSPSNADLLLLRGDGYGRRVNVNQIHVASKPNDRGRLLLSKKGVQAVGVISDDSELWALTERQMIPIDPEMALPSASTAAEKIVPLPAGEQILGIIEVKKVETPEA